MLKKACPELAYAITPTARMKKMPEKISDRNPYNGVLQFNGTSLEGAVVTSEGRIAWQSRFVNAVGS